MNSPLLFSEFESLTYRASPTFVITIVCMFGIVTFTDGSFSLAGGITHTSSQGGGGGATCTGSYTSRYNFPHFFVCHGFPLLSCVGRENPVRDCGGVQGAGGNELVLVGARL